MTLIRARTVDVQATLATLLHEDSEAAANGNDIVSRSEQATAPPHVQQAAEQLRAQGGTGTRVTIDALDAALVQKAQALIATVNPSGRSAAYLSRSEVDRAVAQDPALGGRVRKAWEIVLHKSVDVEGIARARVKAQLSGNTGMFKTFATESEAVNFRGPAGKSVYWLVVTGESPSAKSFVQGINDLWSERFDIDKTVGTVTVTAEH
jgi:hypothetical protein